MSATTSTFCFAPLTVSYTLSSMSAIVSENRSRVAAIS
jgi:hypothetical protein